VELRAAFSNATSSANTAPITVTVDRRASAAGSEDIGPGSVNLLSGDYTIDDTDAGVFGVSVSRSASSLAPALGRQPGRAGGAVRGAVGGRG
jgi:hypothetical protein